MTERDDPLLAALLVRDPAVLSAGAGVYLPPPADERAARTVHDPAHAAAALADDGRRYGPWQPGFHTRGPRFLYADYAEDDAAAVGGGRGVAVLATHADDRITDLAVFRHEFVPRGDAALATVVPDDGRTVVLRYLDDLEAGHAVQAAACFAPEAVYSVPSPARQDVGQRLTLRGRPAIEALFAGRTLSTAHHVLAEFAAVPDSPHAFVSGTVVDLPDGLTCSFVSSMSFAPDGTLARYVVRLCIPGLPWLA